MKTIPILIQVCIMVFLTGCTSESSRETSEGANTDSLIIRVATFNVEDIRTDDLKNPDHPRLKRIAAVIREIRPDIILINEIAYDQPGSPGFDEGDTPGQNGQRLVNMFINLSGSAEPEPLRYRSFMAPSNTGIFSGFDLNNDKKTTNAFPTPPAAEADGAPGKQTPGGRDYGNDSWGFGTFPGQYAMTLLVNEEFEILKSEVRTFQKLPWSAMPDALLPVDPQTGEPWFTEKEKAQFRLSSKSHWDVPVKLPNGVVLHLLCSHPTPPAFDGEEQRNKRRNHDEIRFWADYIKGADYFVDDAGKPGGVKTQSPFVILGDLNADPDEGSSLNNPIKKFLLSHPRINGNFVPASSEPHEKLDPDDTAGWGLRVDYVLPSVDVKIIKGGIWRYPGEGSNENSISDHFPVWLDIAVPAP